MTTMMRAAVVDRPGPPEVLTVREMLFEWFSRSNAQLVHEWNGEVQPPLAKYGHGCRTPVGDEGAFPCWKVAAPWVG